MSVKIIDQSRPLKRRLRRTRVRQARPSVKDLLDHIKTIETVLANTKTELEGMRHLYNEQHAQRVDAQNELYRLRQQLVTRAEEASGQFRLPVSAQLSGVCLEEAALKIGQSWLYELVCAPDLRTVAIKLLRTYGAAHPDNPFFGHVNLRIDPALAPQGWRMTALDTGKSLGSEGL